MKITKHSERTYHYDEFEISHHPEEIIHFRRDRNFNQWEYFNSFEQAWLLIDSDDQTNKLEDLYCDWLYIELLNLGMADKLKIK